MKNELIVVKQLPIIQEQLKLIKEEVTAKVEFAKSLVCTEETVKDVKNMRAELRKEFTDFENKRKEVKKAVLTPYEQFEAVYKKNISDIYKQADEDLKSKIDEVESGLKEKKRNEVLDYFNEYATAKNIDFVTFENANINVTLSASMKSLKQAATDFIDKICDDLALIDTQEHKTEILVEYKKSLNVSAAITGVTARFKAIEEEKVREEERKAREQAIKEAETKVEEFAPPIVEPIAPPVEQEPILTLKFTVRGTRTKLRELKEYLERNEYDYE